MFICKLLPEKMVKTNLPSTSVVEVTKQGDRTIVHLLNANPIKRGNGIEVIEDSLPVVDTKVSIKCEKEPQRVYLAPQDKDIEFVKKDNYVEFTVDKFECHQVVVIE